LNVGQRILEKIIPRNLKGFTPKNLHLSLAALQSLKYRQFLIIVFITVIAYELVGIFYKAVSLSLTRTQTEASAQEPIADKELAKREPVESFKIIIERNLFGSTDKTFVDKQLAEKAPVIPDVATLYDLRGTVAGDSKYGFAVIEEKSRKKQGLYKVGDSLAGGKITRITRNSIVLKIGNEEKNLKMSETKEAPILPSGNSIAEKAPPPVISASGAVVVNRSDISEGLRDIGSLLSQAQIRPYFSMGTPDGFLVTNVKPGSVYQKLGITNGDILQGVNDRNLKTADDMLEFYNTMKGTSSMSLNIRRQGRQEKLNYVFK
jgi:general secretion pathway protein C